MAHCSYASARTRTSRQLLGNRVEGRELTGTGSLLQGDSFDNQPNPLNDLVPQLFVNPGVSVPGSTLGCGGCAIAKLEFEDLLTKRPEQPCPED